MATMLRPPNSIGNYQANTSNTEQAARADASVPMRGVCVVRACSRRITRAVYGKRASLEARTEKSGVVGSQVRWRL